MNYCYTILYYILYIIYCAILHYTLTICLFRFCSGVLAAEDEDDDYGGKRMVLCNMLSVQVAIDHVHRPFSSRAFLDMTGFQKQVREAITFSSRNRNLHPKGNQASDSNRILPPPYNSPKYVIVVI